MDISIAESAGKMKQEIHRKKNRGMPVRGAAWGLAIALTGCGAAPIRQQTSVDTAMGTIVSQTLYVQETGWPASEED